MSSISSISVSTPPAPPAAVAQTPDTSAQSPDLKADGDAEDAGAAQQATLPPLPPGQGTRIDQLA